MSRYNTIRTVKCEHCNKVGKIEKNVSEINQRFGNPFYICKNCGEINYDDGIIEPALLSPTRLRTYSQTQSGPERWIIVWFCSFFSVLPVSLMLDGLLYGLLTLIPPAIVLIWILIKESRTVDEEAYNRQVHNSMIRMLANENYSKAILDNVIPARDSAWETKKGNYDIGNIPETELKKLYYEISDGTPEKPPRAWMLFPAYAIGVFIMLIVALASGKEVLIKEPEVVEAVDLREATKAEQKVTYETSLLIGPFAENNISGAGYYLMADEETGIYYVVLLPNDHLQEYQPFIDGTALSTGEVLTLKGYSARLTGDVLQYAREGIVQIMNAYLGIDEITVEMLSEDALSSLYIEEGRWQTPSSWGMSKAATWSIVVMIAEFMFGFIGYLVYRRMMSEENGGA